MSGPCPIYAPLERLAALFLIMLALTVAGCAGTAPGPLDSALGWVGLQRTEVAERARAARDAAALLPRRVAVRLHAGDVLNTDASGRALAVVARVYRLRSANGFLQLPYEAFLSEPAPDSPLRTDVLGMREVVLAPGQRHESVETLSGDVSHVAVVALFRAPAPQRWRFVFETHAAAGSGLTLGLHGCALSVGTGEPVGAPQEQRRVAGVRCG